MPWETADFAGRRPAARPAIGNRTGRIAAIGLVALFGVAAATLLGSVLLRGGGQVPAVTIPDEAAPQAAAQPVAAEQTAVAEQAALPAGSVRFAGGEAPQREIARNVIAKNWAPAAAAPDSPAVDTARTASILSPAGDVAVAETEQQAVEMESRLAAEGAKDFEVPAPDGDPAAVPVTVASASSSPAEPFPPVSDLTQGRTAKWVNLRAGPDNDARVLTVVPYDAEILTQPDCPHWCAVVYDGRQGYIYKSFVIHPGATAGG
jgi:hypothetical protein